MLAGFSLSAERTAFAVVFMLVLVSVLANGYEFGVSDHNEQLPIIRRVLDGTYLRQDWFVNATAGFSVRSAYALMMAGLSHLLGIDAAFLLVYIASLLAVTWAVFLFASTIWSQSAIGLVAVLVVLYNRAGSLGGSQFVATMLAPSFLAYSMVLFGAYGLLKKRYARSTFLFALAGLIHPLIGSEGAVILATAAIASARAGEFGSLLRKSSPVLMVAIGAALVGYAAQRGRTVVATHAEVINILAWVRHPWHYVPFTWEARVWEEFAAFGFLVAIARMNGPRSHFLDSVILTVIALCAAGTVALVVRPLAFAVKLQTFRMTILLQWAGALYLGRYCWEQLHAPSWFSRLRGLALLCGILSVQFLPPHFLSWLALAVFLSHALEIAAPHLRQPLLGPWAGVIPLAAVGMGLPAVLLIRSPAASLTTVAPVLSGIVAVCFAGGACGRSDCRRYLVLLCTLTSLVAMFLLATAFARLELPRTLRVISRSLHMHLEYSDDFDRLALWAKSNTPPDAVFLVPPYTDDFRLKAERAIVVDFKAFPFTEPAILQWRDRIYDCAGGPVLLGTTWSTQLQHAYTCLETAELTTVAGKYGAGYAITEKGQSLDLPLLYENQGYRLYGIAPARETSAADQ